MVKRLFTFLGVALMLLVVIALAAPLFLGKQAEQLFIKKVSSRFTTEFIIKGDIELSLLRNFPYASLSLKGVELRESLPNSRRNLLEAQKMSFLFGWWDLFRGNYRIERVNIENGALNLRTLLNGETNYRVFAPTPDDDQQTNETVSIQLKQVNLYNISVLYLNERYKQETAFAISRGVMAANFGAVQYDLQLQADMAVKHFYLYNTNYLPEKNAKLDLNIAIDFDKNSYTFGNSTLQVEGSRFNLLGQVQFFEQASNYNLTLNGIDLKLNDLLPIMPKNYRQYLNNMESKGNLQFETTVKGIYTDTQQPAVNVKFNIANGTLSLPDTNAPLQNVQLSGSFTNGALQQLSSSELLLDNCSFLLKGQPFTASGKISNFNQPLANLSLNGAIDLSAFEKLAAQNGYKKLSGKLAFEQVQFNGYIEEAYKSTALIYPAFTGVISLHNVQAAVNGKPIENLTAKLALNGQHSQLQTLQLQAGKTNLTATGNLLNLNPLLFQALGKDTILLSQPVNLNLNLTSPLIDITDLMQYFNADTTALPKPPDEQVVNKQQYATGNLTLQIDQLTQNKFTYTNLKGAVSFNDNEYVIQQITLQLLGGTAELRGNVHIDNQQNLQAKAFLRCEQLDIQQLLANADNFGQTTLTNKNLKGLFTGNFYIVAPFDKQYKLNQQGFKMVADLQLDNGELVDFEPMLALSKFVKVSELKQIKFARLQNQIEIRNRKVYIPAMYINSNALKLTLSGNHSFDNRLLYYVKLNLLDLLTNKFTKQNKLVETDPNPKGGINLYLTVSGAADNPTIKYMKKKKVKQQFSRDAYKQKTDLQKILEQEFNPGKTALTDTLDMEFMNWTEEP